MSQGGRCPQIGEPVVEFRCLGHPDGPAVRRSGKGTLRAASLSRPGAAALRCHRVDAALRSESQSSSSDAWVIPMDQPFAGLVKELFEPQVYPDLAQRPYDVTGWTLPYQMGVEVHEIGRASCR